jgi:hypothetical protein
MQRLVLLFVLAFAAPVYAQPVAQAAPMTARPEAKPEWKGPSGFWTNPYPAKGGAYRWRMMAVGGVFLIGTGYLMVRLLKKANSERRGRR